MLVHPPPRTATTTPATNATAPATNDTTHQPGLVPPIVVWPKAKTLRANAVPTAERARTDSATRPAPHNAASTPANRRITPRPATAATASASSATPKAAIPEETSRPLTDTCWRAPSTPGVVTVPHVRPAANSATTPATATATTAATSCRLIDRPGAAST